MKKKRTEITIEIDELIVIKSQGGQSPKRVWCLACEAEVEMVTPEHAAGAAGVSSRTIYSWIEEGRLHFREEPGGPVLVCSGSLTAMRGG